MFVPLNRTKSSSDVIAVEFYQFPRSASADHETPPIFILKGGPGFEGLERALAEPGRFEVSYRHFLDVSDVVVVGQRGIGSSKPNTAVDWVTKPRRADQPYDDEKAVREFQEALSHERQYWVNQGLDLSGFNVRECAADVRDVADALGYKQISLLGGSFGSHWGMAIMRFHPNLVARAIFTGMEGPDHTWDHPGWIWNVYKRVATDAEASEELRARIPEGGLIARMESLVEGAKQKPITRTVFRGRPNEMTALIDGWAMQRVSRGISGKLKDWPAEVIQMSEGNFSNAVV
ncbi:MAG: alpha/beta hydrolase, partial [Pirellulaceae bacterium]